MGRDDFCKSQIQLFRLQQIQHSLAHTVVKAPTSSQLQAQNHWMHRIQATLTYLQSYHNYTQPPYLHNLISVQRPRSTRSSSVATLNYSATYVILSKNNWSLLPLCFTLPLESTSFIFSSISFWYQLLHFRLTYSFTHQFFLLLLFHHSAYP